MLRDLTEMFAAVGYALDRIARPGADPRTTVLPNRDNEDEADVRALIVLVEIFERLNDRYLDEIRSLDALNGVLLGGIFALFVPQPEQSEPSRPETPDPILTDRHRRLRLLPTTRRSFSFDLNRGPAAVRPKPND